MENKKIIFRKSDARRDWGHARLRNYVEKFNKKNHNDFIISTGNNIL